MLDISDMLYEDDEFDDEFADEFDELFENVSYLYYDDDSIEISREEREKRVLHRLRPVPAFTRPVLAPPAFLEEPKLPTFPSPEKTIAGKRSRSTTASRDCLTPPAARKKMSPPVLEAVF